MSVPAAESKRDIAATIVEHLDDKTLYLLGPGTTVKAIADEMDIPKTLLGIDAIFGSTSVGSDLNERDIYWEAGRRYESENTRPL